MLKHASNTAGSGLGNGQQRNNQVTPQRNIHLRPQQPLNIRSINGSTLQSSVTSVATTTNGTTTASATGIYVANGGLRVPASLLNIAAASGVTSVINSSTKTTPATIATTMTPMTANGIGNNSHTYSNQHVVAANNHNTVNGATICQNYNHNPNHQHTNDYSNYNNQMGVATNHSQHGPGPREALTSLGLLCLVSLLLALLSLIFLLKISPNGREDALQRRSSEDFVIVFDVTLALCALSLSLNLCCLLVCAIQFLFAVKLVRSPMFDGRDNKYLEKSNVSRTCAVGGFFISIPIFLTGIILYTFNHFHSTPAIITSVLIGIGIVFCGGAMVHNVFIWQKEKTLSYRSQPMTVLLASPQQQQPSLGQIIQPLQFLGSHSSQMYHNNHQSFCTPLPVRLHHPTSVTPVSPNHSQGSFNPLVAGAISSSFIMRPATATPPTPKPIVNGCLSTLGGRETSGSVSPGIPPNLDTSNITSTSVHELSTLV